MGSSDAGRTERAGEEQLRPGESELRQLVAALRRIIDRSVLVNAPPEVLARATETLERVGRDLAPYAGARAFPLYGSSFAPGHVNPVLPYSPMVGWLNPVAPPILLELRDGLVTGRVRFGAVFEGPPGSVHGSIVAAAFDQVLAIANIALGHPAMTASLTVHYRRPTPLHTELRIEAQIDRVEGRKVFTKGAIHAGTGVTAEAEGLFVRIDATKAGELFSGTRDQ
jgi:acyl-coenzyme A thioesterase PaaI-like protein